ncbi:hypothetical protein JCM21900_005355 [Sporobolomyces salmonicolor]
MSAPPAYEPLATSPRSDSKHPQPLLVEKPSLARTDTASHRESGSSSPRPSTRTAFLRAVAVTFLTLLSGCVLLGGLYGVQVGVLGRGCSRSREDSRLSEGAAVRIQEEVEPRFGKGRGRWWKRQQLATSGSTEYSYTTDAAGETSTFVKTTRPIVNPGGYTIGTLTGYVAQSSAPAADATSTDSSNALDAEPSSNHSASSLSSAAASSVPPSWENMATTNIPTPTSTIHASSRTSGEAAWTLTLTTTVTTTTTITSLPSSSSSPEGESDSNEVDSPPLHRRALDLEQEEVQDAAVSVSSLPVQTTATGSTEYSTSTDKRGTVVTLVKTTRPIVNPAGYTVGTLDGAWVDVSKQTPTARPQGTRNHEELKKREARNEAA